MDKRIGVTAAAMFALFASSVVLAEESQGAYIGAGLGQSKIEVDGGFDGDDTSFKVFGGYAFNSNFSAELAYFDGGSAEESFGPGAIEVSIDGFNLSAVGSVPLGDTFTLFGRLGYAAYDVKASARAAGFSASASDSDNAMSYGLGGAFSFTQQFQLRAEWEALDVSDGDFTTLSISGLYRF